MAPVAGIEDFRKAIGAGGKIGHHQRGGRTRQGTGRDRECRAPVATKRGDTQGQDRGVSRQFALQAPFEPIQRPSWTLDFDGDAVGIVANNPGQMLGLRQAIDEGAETDTLDRTRQFELPPLAGLGHRWRWMQ